MNPAVPGANFWAALFLGAGDSAESPGPAAAHWAATGMALAT